MERDAIFTLVDIIALICIAIAAVPFIRWINGRPRHNEIALGYPPNLFPEQELTRGGALRALAAAQARLLSVHAQLPRHSALALWIWAFLRELRPAMDSAYRAASVARLYGQTAPLDGLVREVETIERAIAERVVKRLLSGEPEMGDDGLDAHLAALRRYSHELTDGAGGRAAVA